ncbi:hypothetical protein Golomagni_01002 [Golovinomyces magnicellulatus]|nr:hypothetical protein Golomagni_01002 [Golovinomyces magnicellulatus]
MSPPAITMDEENDFPTEIKTNGIYLKLHSTNGYAGRETISPQLSDEFLDMLCVGFGPASLATAVALHDTNYSKKPKYLFLEKEPKFSWHSGMQLPNAKMQISFLKDLATPRNPQSKFTFINYLFNKKRLNQFINLSVLLPSRLEFEDYLKWCANHFEAQGLVQYGMNVQSVCVGSKNSDGKVTSWKVTSRKSNGEIVTKRARNVVIAVGGNPMLPLELKGLQNVNHSSQYISSIKKIQHQEVGRKPRFAVVGSGQSAAEIFNDLWTRFPESEIRFIIKGASLRPSDDSPFVNEIFDPDRVDIIYAQSPSQRAASVNLDRGTNYGVVRLSLLEHLYEKLYMQRVASPSPSEWKACIISNRVIVSARETQDGSSILLRLCDSYSQQNSDYLETLEVDYVYAATGYQCNAHEEMLADVRPYLQNDIAEKSNPWAVQRDYRIAFDPEKVVPDVGIWLQGCNEKTHGLSDTLLSILAIRSGELVHSIFGTPEI